MFEEVGHHVEKIRRVQYGPLALDVPPGDWRNLTLLEVAKLKTAASGVKVASPPSPEISLRPSEGISYKADESAEIRACSHVRPSARIIRTKPVFTQRSRPDYRHSGKPLFGASDRRDQRRVRKTFICSTLVHGHQQFPVGRAQAIFRDQRSPRPRSPRPPQSGKPSFGRCAIVPIARIRKDAIRLALVCTTTITRIKATRMRSKGSTSTGRFRHARSVSGD